MAKHRVRALRTLQVADEDEPKYRGLSKKYHLPGRPSAVFTCGPKRFKDLLEKGHVIEIGPELEPDEAGGGGSDIPIDDPPTDALPLDFPYRAELVRAGFNTKTSLRELENITDVPGIGDAKAAHIRVALDGPDPEDDDE